MAGLLLRSTDFDFTADASEPSVDTVEDWFRWSQPVSPICARKTRKRPGMQWVVLADISRTVDESKEELNPVVVRVVSDTVTRIAKLRDLQANWDGRGAPAIDREIVDFAIDLFGRVASVATPVPSVVPTVGGGVQLEWHTAQRHIELEIEGKDQFTLLIASRDLHDEPKYLDSNNVPEARTELAEAFA